MVRVVDLRLRGNLFRWTCDWNSILKTVLSSDSVAVF